MDDKVAPTDRPVDGYPVDLHQLHTVTMRYRISVIQAYRLIRQYDHDRAALDRAAAALKAVPYR